MKRIILTLIASIFAFLPLAAQKQEGSFKALKGESRVGIEIDFSEASIHGLSEEAFAAYEEDWGKDKPGIVSLIISECNDKLPRGLRVGDFQNTSYTLVVKIFYVTVKGDFSGDVFLYDSEGEEIGSIVDIRGRGGRFGTKLNLIKDGAESFGQNLGYCIRQAIIYGKGNEVYRI